MIPVASTRKQAKSGAIITALGAIYGLTIVPWKACPVGREHTNDNAAAGQRAAGTMSN